MHKGKGKKIIKAGPFSRISGRKKKIIKKVSGWKFLARSFLSRNVTFIVIQKLRTFFFIYFVTANYGNILTCLYLSKGKQITKEENNIVREKEIITINSKTNSFYNTTWKIVNGQMTGIVTPVSTERDGSSLRNPVEWW